MISVPVSAHGVSASISFPELTDHIAKVVLHTKTFYERPLLDAIRSMELRGAYVDVGAHVGNHALFFSRCCQSSLVVAIESDPNTFVALEGTCGHLDDVQLINAAAMHRAGNVSIIRDNPGNIGMNSVAWSDDGVPAITLDALLSDVSDVILVKLDIEGSEVSALEGATEVLAQRPVFSIEARSTEEDEAIATFMGDAGYLRGARYCATPTYLWIPK